MLTTKKRLNISLPPEVEIAVKNLAQRDAIPWATEISRLLYVALEIDEDDVWNTLAAKRDKRGAKFISHHKAWA